MTGKVLGGADAWAWGSAEPFTKRSTFDLNLSIENVKVAKANPWLRQYLKADAKQGDFEFLSRGGVVEWPLSGLCEADSRGRAVPEPRGDAQGESAEDAVAGHAAARREIFENQPRKQVAAQVPFSGTIEGGQTDLLAALGSVLRNAFVSAFTHSIDETISLSDVKEGEPSGDRDSG